MYSEEVLKKLYADMILVRLSEESLVEPILSGDVKCPVHLYSGQEAVAAGIGAVLNEKDSAFGTHRSHGHYLVKGGSVKEMIAEIHGKSTGCSKGRGGSMHLYAPDKGFLGAAPIVAGTISLAVGAGMASSIRKDGTVAVSFFGDGAVGEGVLYESLNLAALRKLPVIFVCENNLYSTHLHISEIRPNDEIYKIAEPFGITSFRVDGNDVLEVYEAAEKAVEQCRNNNGPVFIETLTYRMRGHVGPDDNIQGTHTDIRPAAEVEDWRQKDPIERLKKYLLENGVADVEELDLIEREIQQEINEAYVFTNDSQLPPKSELEKYVFSK
ncbi:MAG: thiamine pyrophosphate-dependent dehydrogenase E1 component subunit alpha [Candidatus Electryonea clarkiae]|nr:thiamine pyrophosphate-dependent dehydrogenase E1 component subunit alpha [Candidatus Electryonea clarkiae]MDP8285847.1 thiamine pyrophosphate-dependent dehydrogenase E1 component subunit alpha [Candidatus Electryonea clarkiae]